MAPTYVYVRFFQRNKKFLLKAKVIYPFEMCKNIFELLLFIEFLEDWPGVEVSRIHDGGNAAMVVSLFSIGMARFRFVIPEQIIIFDPKLKVN